jgi:hypothetical protein
MKKLEVKFSADGLKPQNVAFAVMQAGRVLVEDTLTGKISAEYSRSYEVEADESHIDLFVHNVNDPTLTITASLS